jgi:hypothetical protein
MMAPLLPAPAAFPPRQRPAEVPDAPPAQLRERGLTRLYGACCRRFAVLSVAAGITVWTNGRILWWHANGTNATWPAADHPGAARQLSNLMPEASQSLYPARPHAEPPGGPRPEWRAEAHCSQKLPIVPGKWHVPARGGQSSAQMPRETLPAAGWAGQGGCGTMRG